MQNEKQTRMTLSRFRLFRSHIRGPITPAVVKEYHSILGALQDVTGEILQTYSIPEASMVGRLLPQMRRTATNREWLPEITRETYCDEKAFSARIDALFYHLEKCSVEPSTLKC